MGVITDPIADMLTRIRNGLLARHPQITVPASRMKLEIARILKTEGFITDFQVDKDHPEVMRIQLRYGERKEGIITGLRRISRPGLRVYARKSDIPRVLGGLGIAIISTSNGLMTGHAASRAGLGGEVVAYVW